MNDGSAPTEAPVVSAPEISRLVEIIERLHREHTVSFIAAGDEKIYAYGGGGYVAIVSERLFDSAVDFETPTTKFRIDRDESGRLTAVSATGGEETSADDLTATAHGLELYYRRRIGTV